MGRRDESGIRTMSEIHKALAVFQLEPGSSQDAIKRRYKRLSKVWHPDRFQTEEDKREAEEELKKINNANDVFKKHFQSGHRATGCECQKPAASSTGSEQRSHGPGPGPQKKSDDTEAEAKRRDDERRRKAAAEEAARKAADQQKQQQQQTAQDQYQDAQRRQDELKWNKIRWQIAAAEAALFIALCIFGNIGFGIKEWWHDFSWKWERDHPSHTDTPPSTSTNTATTTTTDIVVTPPKVDIVTPPVVEEDPCALTGPSPTPPHIILPYLHNWVRQAVTQWTVKCRGNNDGAVVTGSDEKGRLVNWQNYGPNWVFIQQWQIKYEYQQTTVMLFKAPNDFMGRSIYRYDQDNNVIEVRQLDSQQRQVVTATIQRRPGGSFYQTILKYYDSMAVMTNTRILDTPDDPQMASTFYLFETFGTIAKTGEQAPTLATPDLPLPSSTTPDTGTLLDRLNRLNKPSRPSFFSPNKPLTDTLPGSGPGVPYGTATGTDIDSLYKSPFSPGSTSTPSTDSLMKKYGLDKLTVPDSTSGTSLYESFKKRRVNQSLQELLKGTGTNTGTSP